MPILRRLGTWFLATIFIGALWLWLTVAPLSGKLTNPDTFKRWVAASGVYDDLLPQLLEQAAEKGTDDQIEPGQVNDNPVDTQAIRDIFAQAVPPDVLRGYVETTIDGVYDWLQGKTTEPQITIDLSERRPAIIAAFTDYVHQKLAGAPTCSRAVADQAEFDPLSENCIPPGMTIDQVADQAAAELTKPDSPLENPVLTSQKLIDDLRQKYRESPDENVDPDKILENGSRAYGHLTRLPWYLFGIMVLTAVGLVLLGLDRWRTGRRLAIKLLIAGSIVTLLTLIASKVFGSMIDRVDVDVAERTVNLNKTLQPLYETVVRELSHAIYWFSVPTLVAGLAGTVGLTIFLHRRDAVPKPSIASDK